MPRNLKCCVGNCRNSRQDAILFKFPETDQRHELWLQCLSNVCDTKTLIPGVSVVCSKHFEARFITPKSRLIGTAYPSLFTDEEMDSGQPTTLLKEFVNPQAEHNYARKMHYDHTYCMERKLETSEGTAVKKRCLESTAMEVDVSPLPGVSGLSSMPPNALSGTDANEEGQRSAEIDKVPLAGCTEDSKLTAIKTPESSQTMQKNLILYTPKKPKPSNRDQPEPCSKGQPSKQRLVSRVNELTPLRRRIYKEYKKAKAQLSFQKRANNALKFCQETALEKKYEKMSPFAKTFIKMQINLCSKKKNARRFTTEEKVIALSIMKQSPKCYRFLRKIFILPSKSTLNAMISKLFIAPGINPQVFNLFKKEIDSWDPRKKLCSIIFDEMSLEEALTYDKNKDCINGFVELQHKKCDFADHALVFMLRGALYKWQQPICFYFCQGATPAYEIKNILRQLVDEIVKLGLNPIALICDQGSTFQSALNKFREETRRDQILQDLNPDGTVTISGVNLNIIYDPSHLIKGIRNNFIEKNIVSDGKISKWQDIVDVYETDCQHTETRLLHKLNDQCVIPEKIKKMKVKNCVRVLSKTVSAALSYTANFSHYVDGRPVSTTLRNTSETVCFLDQLFDSVNGATTSQQRSRGKALKKAVTKTSTHHTFWPSAITKLEKLKFVNQKGEERSVPSVKNFIITIKSLMKLWQYFQNMGLKIMRPRYFSSDPIENFFGQVRAYNYRSNDPNCHNFSCTFKSLLITRLIKFHSDTFNCEDDSAEQAVNLISLFEKPDCGEPSHSATEPVVNVVEQARRERLNMHSRAYTAGWVVGKLLNQTNCRECQDSLTISESVGIHDWISHREYTKAQKQRLKYPSEGAVRCFSTIVTETNEYLEMNANKNKLSSEIKKKLISKLSFDFIDCAEHKERIVNYFIEITVKFTIMNWCNTINKILKGTDIARLKRRGSLPKMQQKAYDKFVKKLKNKSFNK